MAATVRQQKVI